jgi:hypothetical protein
MENILGYWGLDWLAMTLSLLGVFWLGNSNKTGFLTISTANVIWIFLGLFFMKSAGITVGNFIFFIINLRGYFKWKVKQRPGSQRR